MVRRVAAGLALGLVVVVVGVVLARKPIARWAVERALASAGLTPVSLEVRGVGLGGIEVERISIGADAWLTADEVAATYTLGELWRGEVGVVEIRGARWRVAVRDGRVDWGYPLSGAGGPVRLPFPPRRVDVVGATVEVQTAGGVTLAPVTARLTRAAGGFDARAEMEGPGRAASVVAEARADGDALTVTLDAEVRRDLREGVAGPVPPASRMSATVARSQRDASLRIVGNAELVAVGERLGGVVAGAERAQVDADVSLAADWRITAASGSLRGSGIAVGPARLETVVLNAIHAGDHAFDLTGSAAGDGWEAPTAAGSVRWEARGEGTMLAATLRAVEPARLGGEEAAASGTLGVLEAQVEVFFGAGGTAPTDQGDGQWHASGTLVAGDGAFQLGDVSVSGAELAASLDYPESIRVESLGAVVGDGGTVRAEPFTIDLDTRSGEARVALRNLSLAQWLPLLTGDRARGEGRVSGDITVGAAYGPDGFAVTRLDGGLSADPPRGTIRVSDTGALADLMERQDPRFAADPTMAAVRDRVVDALRDFAFTTLRVDLSSRGDRTSALAYLSGFGRHGEDPQGINLTLDLQADDAALGLVTRMASKARLRQEAGEALERFFGETGGEP